MTRMFAFSSSPGRRSPKTFYTDPFYCAFMKIVKIPFMVNLSSHNLGCKEAPDEVVRVFNDIWTNESLNRIPKASSLEVCEIKGMSKDFSYAIEEVYNAVKKLGLGLYLGGDHSITYPCFKAFSEKFNNPGLIVFDAHPDVFSENEFVTHQDWLKFLLEEKCVKGENVIIVALRNPAIEEIAYLMENGVRFYHAKDIFLNIENVCDAVMETAHSWDGLYLSIDIDSLDPAFAPGTGYLEPGGLSTRELLYFIQRLRKLRNLKAFDIVEINPRIDINGMTVKAGAKIMGEML